jgi:A/G-specific adenine glycosylase
MSRRELLVDALLAWYRRGHRDLPWRRTRDPYAIWVSEIMLQQTQVATVIPYFERWMARFPTARALAAAPLDEVLTSWAGLGYYARARNLHRAAGEVVARWGGAVPRDTAAVRALPGIGAYTAGAIMSIAFDVPEPIVDGNIIRVLSRVEQLPGAVDDAQLKKHVWALAAELVPAGAASDFNQALMELGALVCTPRTPACARCPLREHCRAHESGAPESYPAPKAKAKPPSVRAVAIVIERDDALLLLRRPPRGLWGGLWEPPMGEIEKRERPVAAAARVAKACTGLELLNIQALDRFEHVLTHRRMQFHAFVARARRGARLALDGYDAARWQPRARATALGVAAWTRRLLARSSPDEELQEKR